MERNFLILIILGSTLAALLILFNFMLFIEVPELFSTINFLSIFIFSFPIVIYKYIEYKKKKELEEMFPVFLRDFVENVRGGMTVPQAFKFVSENDYGPLSVYVKKISAQLDWGIPLEKVLLKFSKEAKSKIISRIISSVVESHRFGGNLADTFEALSATAIEVERLRAERRLYLHSQMMTGYIVFFVFLGVIIGLEKFLVPTLSQVGVAGMPGVEARDPERLAMEYKEIFRNLIVLQGLFAGLAVGKMAEGAIVAGWKHSLIMALVGFVIFTLVG
jgi:flagellar protein FlaJ